MVRLNDHSFVVSPPGDHSSTSFVPGSVDILEVVWIDPRFEYVFVLFVRWVVNSGGTRVKQGVL